MRNSCFYIEKLRETYHLVSSRAEFPSRESATQLAPPVTGKMVRVINNSSSPETYNTICQSESLAQYN